MKKVKKFEEFIVEKKSEKKTDVKTSIKHARISQELKDEALKYLTPSTKVKKSKIYDLKFPTELNKKLKRKV